MYHFRVIRQPSTRSHYTLVRYILSVCLSVWHVFHANRKRNTYRTVFKVSGEVIRVRSNWQSKLYRSQGKRSRSLGRKYENRLVPIIATNAWLQDHDDPSWLVHISPNTLQQLKCVLSTAGGNIRSGSTQVMCGVGGSSADALLVCAFNHDRSLCWLYVDQCERVCGRRNGTGLTAEFCIAVSQSVDCMQQLISNLLSSNVPSTSFCMQCRLYGCGLRLKKLWQFSHIDTTYRLSLSLRIIRGLCQVSIR